MYRLAIYVFALFAIGITPVLAEQSQWHSISGFKRYMREDLNGGKVIPTGIDCRVRNREMEIRLNFVPLNARPKPFHKWQWVIALESRLNAEVAKLRRSDRLDLKYRVVFQDKVIWKDNNAWVCAIAFR